MEVACRIFWIATLAAAAAGAQSVEIYSEFQRVDPFGKIVASDRALVPREILSPGVARNGHASFHVAVSVPPHDSYLLYVLTNPLDACRVSLYKEHFVKTEEGWIPDSLAEVQRLPDFGAMPDPDDGIEGQTTRVYLLDLWIPPDAGVGRFRVEVQLKTAYWIVRPMEVRVVAARIPEVRSAQEAAGAASLPSLNSGADSAVSAPLARYLAGGQPSQEAEPLTVRGVIRRNAVQDMALAGSLDPAIGGPEAIGRRVAELFRINYAFVPRMLGAEWYLRVRDFLDSLPAPR